MQDHGHARFASATAIEATERPTCPVSNKRHQGLIDVRYRGSGLPTINPNRSGSRRLISVSLALAWRHGCCAEEADALGHLWKRKRGEARATRRRDGTAFEFSIGGQDGIMRLTPCKIGPLWAACRSVDDATQLPRKRALLHAITCTHRRARARVLVHTYTRVRASSYGRSKCAVFSANSQRANLPLPREPPDLICRFRLADD